MRIPLLIVRTIFVFSEELIARDIEEFEKQKVHMKTKFKVNTMVPILNGSSEIGARI